MPEEDVLDFMSITPQALYYGEPGWLSHKILLGGERSHEDTPEQRDRTAATRQMLGHGYITKSTVESLETKPIRQDGPISYSETTTKDSIFAEDVNRCLQINADESEEQTGEVLDATAADWVPGPDNSDAEREKMVERHQDFQRRLEPVTVRIPYIKALARMLPAKDVKIRRIFKRQIIPLIEVIAYLHQFTRKKNQWGQLEADYDDYQLARKLVLGSLHLAIGLGKDYEKCQEIERKLPNKSRFNSAEAEASLGLKRKATLANLEKLQAKGRLKKTGLGTSHKGAIWEKAGKPIAEMILPTVATLRKAMEEIQK
jgi:hypothetical protein